MRRSTPNAKFFREFQTFFLLSTSIIILINFPVSDLDQLFYLWKYRKKIAAKKKKIYTFRVVVYNYFAFA